MQFMLYGNQLYKRSHNYVLLWCIDETEALEIMHEVHAGVCGPHISGVMLAKKNNAPRILLVNHGGRLL
jgi:hypothetical protein